MYPNAFYRVSVKALIRDEACKVLVVKENQDTWSLPGGGIDHGEVPEVALLRELKEELGVGNADISSINRTLTFELPEKQAWLLWIVYDVKLCDEFFVLGDGVSAANYIDPVALKSSDDIFEKLVYEAASS